jgi:hypothetical protein
MSGFEVHGTPPDNLLRRCVESTPGPLLPFRLHPISPPEPAISGCRLSRRRSCHPLPSRRLVLPMRRGNRGWKLTKTFEVGGRWPVLLHKGEKAYLDQDRNALEVQDVQGQVKLENLGGYRYRLYAWRMVMMKLCAKATFCSSRI